MSDTQVSIDKLSLEDFMRLVDEEAQRFELIDGEMVFMTPTKFQHNEIAAKVMMALNDHAAVQGLGRAYIETTFILPDADDPDWVRGSRIPDVVFISATRLAEYKTSTENWEDKPLMLVPDLVVEIVSPTDSYSAIDRKVEGYLRDGVQLVWIIDPKQERVNVEGVGGRERLSKGDVLKGGDVVEGFEMLVGAIFE